MTAIDVRSVSVSYGAVPALDDVSLEVQAGRVTGLIGMNGSGKSTLFKSVVGLVRPQRGTVTLEGLTPTEARRRGIPFETLVPLFTTGPARVAGLSGVGEIVVGAPAHLAVFGLDDTLRIDARALQHRNPISAYDGKLLTGRIRRTWLRGTSVYDASEGGAGEAPWFRRPPSGHLLSRETQ